MTKAQTEGCTNWSWSLFYSFFLRTLGGLFMPWRRSYNSTSPSLQAPTHSSTSVKREPYINRRVTADERAQGRKKKNTVSFNAKLMTETKPVPTTWGPVKLRRHTPTLASSSSFSRPPTPPLSGASLHLNSRVASQRLRARGDAVIHQPDTIGRSLFWARWTRHIHHFLVGSKPFDFPQRHVVLFFFFLIEGTGVEKLFFPTSFSTVNGLEPAV